MATKSKVKLPVEEVAICQRLRELRERLGISQQAFAVSLGITRVRLASYETFKAPLKFDVGYLICRNYAISYQWLAKGEGEIHGYPAEANLEMLMQVPSNSNFSKGYELFLALPSAVRDHAPPGKKYTPAKSREMLRAMVHFWESTLGDYELLGFVDYIWECAEDYRHDPHGTLFEHKRRRGARKRAMFPWDKGEA